jgi:hypothetical protein
MLEAVHDFGDSYGFHAQRSAILVPFICQGPILEGRGGRQERL